MSGIFDAIFSRLRLPRHAMTALRAEVGLDPARSSEIAREVAAQVTVGELSIGPDPAQPERGFQVNRGGQAISTFALIVSRDLGELGKGEAGRRSLSVHWSGKTEKRNEKLLGTRRDSAFSLIATLAVTGVPGFPAYEAFLGAYAERLRAEDPSASAEILTP